VELTVGRLSAHTLNTLSPPPVTLSGPPDPPCAADSGSDAVQGQWGKSART
jgi:hypothetical protein